MNRLVKNMGFENKAAEQCADTVRKLYNLFLETDATLVEINPLAETPEGDVYVSGYVMLWFVRADGVRVGVRLQA